MRLNMTVQKYCTNPIMWSVIMLSGVMRSVIMLSAVRLSVILVGGCHGE